MFSLFFLVFSFLKIPWFWFQWTFGSPKFLLLGLHCTWLNLLSPQKHPSHIFCTLYIFCMSLSVTTTVKLRKMLKLPRRSLIDEENNWQCLQSILNHEMFLISNTDITREEKSIMKLDTKEFDSVLLYKLNITKGYSRQRWKLQYLAWEDWRAFQLDSKTKSVFY